MFTFAVCILEQEVPIVRILTWLNSKRRAAVLARTKNTFPSWVIADGPVSANYS